MKKNKKQQEQKPLASMEDIQREYINLCAKAGELESQSRNARHQLDTIYAQVDSLKGAYQKLHTQAEAVKAAVKAKESEPKNASV